MHRIGIVSFILILVPALLTVQVRAEILPTIGSGRSTEEPIVVDLTKGIVDGIRLRMNVGVIVKEIGQERVIEEEELLEGHPSVFYKILFHNHEIYKHWNAFSFEDPVFRTNENLGVGSKVREFNDHHGIGRIGESEGSDFAIYYRSSDPKYQFTLSVEVLPQYPYKIEDYLDSPVTEVWVW